MAQSQTHHHHGHQPNSHAGHAVAAPARPPFSLLRLSAAERLAGVLVLSLILWGGVWWALQ